MRRVPESTSETADLVTLNQEYIHAVRTSDVAWFDARLALDFRCSLPDGSIIDRDRFLQRAARPLDVSELQVHDVEVRVFGDAAIVHARTTFALPDGRRGSGRYTDVWSRHVSPLSQWVVMAAHFTRNAD